jgi:excinuclease UvrABC helicase subunit UvrB
MTTVSAEFRLVADYQMTGDQPEAVDKLVDGLRGGQKHQTLLGVTGSGKGLVTTCACPSPVTSPSHL